jgi:hypothetical protein
MLLYKYRAKEKGKQMKVTTEQLQIAKTKIENIAGKNRRLPLYTQRQANNLNEIKASQLLVNRNNALKQEFNETLTQKYTDEERLEFAKDFTCPVSFQKHVNITLNRYYR